MKSEEAASEPAARASGGISKANARAWALLMRWGNVIDGVERDVREAAGVSLGGLLVLRALAEDPEQRLTMNQLSARVGGTMGLSRSAVSRLAAQLERSGLVEPPEPNDVRRNEDGRTRAVILTRAGAAAYKRGWPAYVGAVERRFARHLDEPTAVAVATAVERVLIGMGEEISDTRTDGPR